MTELEVAIRAQPDELRRLAGLELPSAAKRLAAGERLWLVGTGTSWHAAELGAAMFARAGVDARFATSSEFARGAPLRAGDGVIVISHTGETAYARAARQRALDLGSPTVSITATGVGWPEAIETGERERSETYTRSYTSALAVLALIAGELGAEGLGPEALVAAADATAVALEAPSDFPEPARLTVLAGLGPTAVTAREGALKLREAARLPSRGLRRRVPPARQRGAADRRRRADRPRPRLGRLPGPARGRRPRRGHWRSASSIRRRPATS